MAERDRSQKVAFVYTNLYDLYKRAKNAQVKDVENLPKSRVIQPEEIGENVKITTFKPRTLESTLANRAKVVPPKKPLGANAFDDLKGNIERLQDMHSKLRFMLKELEDLVGSKKN